VRAPRRQESRHDSGACSRTIEGALCLNLDARARRAFPRKATRSCACTLKTATIENGFVFLPEAAPWLADYLAELLAFPAGRHDDQVDSTAQALAWAKKRKSAPNSFLGMMELWGAPGWREELGY
jgi:predicted phage terminase large subunit-like protein